MTDFIPQCCCKRRDCPSFLSVYDHIEDLRQKNTLAGELGQALLARHEAYIAESQREKGQMMERIDSLERWNTELEGKNKEFLSENRELLNQLESLNTSIKDSDDKTKSLTEILQATEKELCRMNQLASNTSQLHDQIGLLEEDLSAAHSVVSNSLDEQKLVRARWSDAEKTIASLTKEIELIQQEAQEERQRHEEVLARMDRKRNVDIELRNSRSLAYSEQRAGVVSNFVNDILQDNANLQIGIVELREMLERSNDEIERLRERFSSPTSSDIPHKGISIPTLGSELNSTKEIHVHHHYHAPRKSSDSTQSRVISSSRRKAKIKTARPSISNSISSATSTPCAALASTSISIPSNRYSIQSEHTILTNSSSLPSSPYAESIFDRTFADSATDLSRPSSPEGSVQSPRNLSKFSDSDVYDHNSESNLDLVSPDRELSGSPLASVPRFTKPRRSSHLDHDALPAPSVIMEENEDDMNTPKRRSSVRIIEVDETATPLKSPLKERSYREELNQSDHSNFIGRPSLRRAASHESLISIHGMDIHTLQSRPSQLLLGKFTTGPAMTSSVTAAAKVTGTNVIGTKASPSRQLRPQARKVTSQAYLSGIVAQHQQSQPKKNPKSSLTGWVWSKWGTSFASQPVDDDPFVSGDSLNKGTESSAKSSSASSSIISATSNVTETMAKPIPTANANAEPATPTAMKVPITKNKTSPHAFNHMRSPGVNQPGPIWGLFADRKGDLNPVIKSLNVEALQQSLQDQWTG